MFPRITFNQLSLHVEQSVKKVSDQQTKTMPVIPPRRTLETTGTIPQDPDEVASWFMVLSPRESRGVAGPFSVPQLRQMYKYGDLDDKSLLWSEGEDDWHQLIHQRNLRPKLLQIPIVPPRVGSYNSELEVFDPVLDLPATSQLKQAASLSEFEFSKACNICGSFAASHLPQNGEQFPDLYKCLEEIGTTQHASEILPGFLWVGNAGSSKKRSLLKLGLTLIINCGLNMNNPMSNPPYYRCRDAALVEHPTNEFSSSEIAMMLALFEKVYDWVELERIYPEHGSRSDPPRKEYRGPTDRYGMPLNAEKPFRKLQTNEKCFPPRVLMWSRLGHDRSCVIAASYLSRRYGISAERSVEIISRNRPTCAISNSYMQVLKLWANKYSLGILLCADCQTQGQNLSDLHTEGNAVVSEFVNERKPEMAAEMELNHDEPYEAFTVLMRNHFPMLVKDLREVEVLSNTSTYLFKISVGFSLASPWSGLLDLDLRGRGLSDITIAVLLQLLAGNEIIPRLRAINLESNQMTNAAMKALLIAYFPIEDLNEGDEYILDDSLQKQNLVQDSDCDDDESSDGHGNRNSFNLTSLDLSHNRLNEYGVKYLCYFLKQCNTLTSLDVSNNELDDFLCADIMSCLEKPLPDFIGIDTNTEKKNKHSAAVVYGDDDSVHSGELLPLHNCSITSLNIGFNKFGSLAAHALGLVLKHNAVLRVLSIELCHNVPASSFRDISNSTRVYNSTLCELVMSHTPLTVKSAECVARMMDSMDSRIARLEMSCCDLKHQHIELMAKYIPTSKTLMHLNLSGNSLSDKGAEHVAEIIRGKRDLNGVLCPPLQHLDLCNCGFKMVGCATIMTAISTRPSIKVVDISCNSLDVEPASKTKTSTKNLESATILDCNSVFWTAIAISKIYELRMNSCVLKSTGATTLFTVLSNRNSLLSGYLKNLYLSDNRISDCSTTSLCTMLESNAVLELLDLSFNEYTNISSEFMRHAVKVMSHSDHAKKVCGLTVNMLSNKCDPYVLETPGLSRSKNSFTFGTYPNHHDSLNCGFSHIAHRARGNFLVRKELDNEYRKYFPLETLNSVT